MKKESLASPYADNLKKCKEQLLNRSKISEPDSVQMSGRAYLEFKHRFDCHADLVRALELTAGIIESAVDSGILHKDHLDALLLAKNALKKARKENL